MIMNPCILHLKKEWHRHATKHAPQKSITESGMAIMLHLQLCSTCSTCYTMIQMKNSTRSVSAITMENTGDKHNSYHRSHREAISTDTFHCQQDTEEDKGKSVMCVLYVLCMVKRDEAMSTSEKIKPLMNCNGGHSHAHYFLLI